MSVTSEYACDICLAHESPNETAEKIVGIKPKCFGDERLIESVYKTTTKQHICMGCLEALAGLWERVKPKPAQKAEGR